MHCLLPLQRHDVVSLCRSFITTELEHVSLATRCSMLRVKFDKNPIGNKIKRLPPAPGSKFDKKIHLFVART